MQIMSDLHAEGMAARVIEIAASEGEAAAAASLRFAGLQAVAPIAGTSSQAVAVAALSLENRLQVLNQRLISYPQDAYQRIVAMYSPNTLLGMTTSRVQQAATVQRFLAKGITGFIDKSNRRWTVGAYAEMAGRTTIRQGSTREARHWAFHAKAAHHCAHLSALGRPAPPGTFAKSRSPASMREGATEIRARHR